MAPTETVKHEIVQEAGDYLLHVYLPEGVESGAVELSFSTAVEGRVSVHLDSADGNLPIGMVCVEGYCLHADAQAKYKKSRRRYTIRLVKMQHAMPRQTLPDDDVEETFHDALSDIDETAPDASATVAAAAATASAPSGDEEDGEDGLDEEARKAVRKERKKAKKAAKKAAKVEGAESQEPTAGATEETEVEHEEGPVAATEQVTGGAGEAASKKRKKKKKKTAAVADLAAQADPDSDPEPEPEPEAAPAVQSAETAAAAAAGPTGPPPPSNPPQHEVRGPAVAPPSPPPTPTRGRKAIHVNMADDFADGPIAVSELGATSTAAPDLYNLSGPILKVALVKNDHKGEDRSLLAPNNTWTLPGINGSTPFSAFGVFDGHGGKAVATYTAKNVLPLVAKYVDRCKAEDPELLDMAALPLDIGEEQRRCLAAQEALAERLPKAMVAGFVEANDVCMSRFKESGTTATLAMAVGWQLLVASVGDSLAYLDTGTEIVQISGNHRVSDSPHEMERERVQRAGGEIAQSLVDDVVAGPLRVWPGGLMMTRSIGDHGAGDLCIPEPEVRQVTLPPNGARLIIASDGLWDAVQHKTAITNIRKMPAGQAANIAMHSAIKKKGLHDDITIVIVDFCCNPEDRFPASLDSGRRREGSETTQVLYPLDAPTSSWKDLLAERRTAIMATMCEAEHLASQAAAAADSRAVAEQGGSGGGREGSSLAPGQVSDTYMELSTLRVDLDSLSLEPELTPETEVEGEWQIVGKPEPQEASLDYMRELRAAARPLQEGAVGPGREQRRGSRGGRHGVSSGSGPGGEEAVQGRAAEGGDVQRPAGGRGNGRGGGRGRGGQGRGAPRPSGEEGPAVDSEHRQRGRQARHVSRDGAPEQQGPAGEAAMPAGEPGGGQQQQQEQAGQERGPQGPRRGQQRSAHPDDTVHTSASPADAGEGSGGPAQRPQRPPRRDHNRGPPLRDQAAPAGAEGGMDEAGGQQQRQQQPSQHQQRPQRPPRAQGEHQQRPPGPPAPVRVLEVSRAALSRGQGQVEQQQQQQQQQVLHSGATEQQLASNGGPGRGRGLGRHAGGGRGGGAGRGGGRQGDGDAEGGGYQGGRGNLNKGVPAATPGGGGGAPPAAFGAGFGDGFGSGFGDSFASAHPPASAGGNGMREGGGGGRRGGGRGGGAGGGRGRADSYVSAAPAQG